MAHTAKEIFPAIKLAIGLATGESFYYDFNLGWPFTPEDLSLIEKDERTYKKDTPFTRKTMPRKDAIELFKKMGEDIQSR